ncbi:MAG: O-antigen ligase family protein, partial [Thermoanaerobaculia bacterium]|nr:O-antigen ligase family protein [Thermoanaerobaculia bacterium]
SYDRAASLRSASDLFNFLVPLLALLLVTRSAQARWLSRALVSVACVIALHALVQYALGADQLSHRPTGPFSHYMTLGGFLVLVDCFLLAWIAFADGWRRWWSWAALLLLQAALLVSFTRNAWIALTALVVVVTLVRRPRLLLAWAALFLVLLVLAPTPLVARFGSIVDLDERSNYDRLCMAYAGAEMIADRPLLGHGPRTVRILYPYYRHPTAPSLWVPHLHNSFLNLGAERGLLSVAALLGMLGVAARRAFERLRASPPQAERELLVAVLLVILATLVTGLFEDYWNDTEIQRLVLFSLALPFCLPPSTAPAPDRTSSPDDEAPAA